MSAIVAASHAPGGDGAWRWSMPTSLTPEDWHLAIQSWNSVGSQRIVLEALPAALAYVEIGRESAIERAELAAALEKRGLLLQQFATFDRPGDVRGYAVECTALT